MKKKKCAKFNNKNILLRFHAMELRNCKPHGSARGNDRAGAKKVIGMHPPGTKDATASQFTE